MPRLPLGLEAAKAKDASILEKLGKVQHAAQSQKQQTKLNQQRLEWTEQARRLAAEAKRLEDDVASEAEQVGISVAMTDEQRAGLESTADMWFQVAGVRQLFKQLRQRDPERLKRAPDQAVSLQGIVGSTSAAISGLGSSLASQAAQLEDECSSLRRALRHELTAEKAWSTETRRSEDRCDLSDEEDALFGRIGGGPEAYEADLAKLNDQVITELAALDQELTDLRRKRSAWNDDSHFRFMCIRQQFHGRGRELLMERLGLEFPHLSREQLQAHEAHCDAVRFASQRQAAAFRQWRRDRLALLRKYQALVEERQGAEESQAARRQGMLEQREKTRALHDRLQVERARASSLRAERQKVEDVEQRRLQQMEAEREQACRKRAQAVKSLCRANSEKRREVEVQKAEQAAERERREAAERARRLERNGEIIRLRRQMDELKQREAAQRRQAAEQEQREREQRLQQAMERLRVEAPRDPERLLKVPSRAQMPAYSDPQVCTTAGRGPHAGFDEGRLMADARYKVSAALQAAGLYHTKAGQEALLRVAAPRAAVPHEVSSVFAAPAPGGYPGR